MDVVTQAMLTESNSRSENTGLEEFGPQPRPYRVPIVVVLVFLATATATGVLIGWNLP